MISPDEVRKVAEAFGCTHIHQRGTNRLLADLNQCEKFDEFTGPMTNTVDVSEARAAAWSSIKKARKDGFRHAFEMVERGYSIDEMRRHLALLPE